MSPYRADTPAENVVRSHRSATIDKRTRRLLKAERRELHERLGWRRR